MKSKPGILHVADKLCAEVSGIAGLGRLFSWWFPLFDASRFDVRCIGLRELDARTPAVPAHGTGADCLGKGKFELSTAAALRQMIRELKTDIVHLHGYGATNFGRIATRGLPVRVIVHEHFVDPLMPLYQQLADYALSPITDAAIASSDSVRDFMTRYRRLPADKIRVVYDAPPLARIEPLRPEQAQQAKQRAGLPTALPVVGMVGRLEEQKGATFLLEAAAVLAALGFDARYVIVGDGPLLAPLREQALNYGIRDRVIFAVRPEEAAYLPAAFDVQVFPSLWEGTPASLFEAMASGRAIVASSVGGLAEILQHRRNALLVPPCDSLGLGDALRVLLEEPSRRVMLGRQAMADSSCYDAVVAVRDMESLYAQLMTPTSDLLEAGTG